MVQPAVGWELLNGDLAEDGLFFPHDRGPGAVIGGMVGTGCRGTNSYQYGTMKDWVLGLTVVLADGTIVKTRQRPRRSSAGYDLTRIFIGSEGTLGLIAAVELLDEVQMECINDSGSTPRPWEELPTLFFKFDGTPTSVKEQIALVQHLAHTAKSTSFEFACDDDEAKELW